MRSGVRNVWRDIWCGMMVAYGMTKVWYDIGTV